jgi:hypothetical protein
MRGSTLSSLSLLSVVVVVVEVVAAAAAAWFVGLGSGSWTRCVAAHHSIIILISNDAQTRTLREDRPRRQHQRGRQHHGPDHPGTLWIECCGKAIRAWDLHAPCWVDG